MSFAQQFIPGAHWLGIGAVICSILLVRLLARHSHPVKRPFAWLVAAVVTGLAAFTFQLMVLNALSSGEVSCLGKGCDGSYTWLLHRPFFWGNVIILQGLACFAWAMTAYAIGVVIGLWTRRSNETMKPT